MQRMWTNTFFLQQNAFVSEFLCQTIVDGYVCLAVCFFDCMPPFSVFFFLFLVCLFKGIRTLKLSHTLAQTESRIWGLGFQMNQEREKKEYLTNCLNITVLKPLSLCFQGANCEDLG